VESPGYFLDFQASAAHTYGNKMPGDEMNFQITKNFVHWTTRYIHAQ